MKVLWRKLKTASRLSLSEWQALNEAYFLLLAVRLLLFFLPPAFVPRAFHPAKPEPTKFQSRLSFSKEDLRRLFQVACRYQSKAGCLATSLAQQRFLARHGFLTTLRIGVLKKKSELWAHAWCENLNAGPFQPLEPLHP